MEFSKEVKTVSSFKNSDFGELKIIIIDEEPYFIGSPIASFLGYTNPRKAIRDHEKSSVLMWSLQSHLRRLIMKTCG